MIRLLVFDLDGTLVDSHRDLADATNALLAELGASALPYDAVTSMIGEGAATLVRRALTQSGLDPELPGALDRFLGHYDARLLATTRPYEGVVSTLDRLRRAYRLAVLTNKPSGATSRVLMGLGFADRFDGILGGDTEYGRKPNPAGLLALASRAGVAPHEAMLVGDSPIDLATARRAGARICLARYGFGYRFDPRDFDGTESFIDEPSDLIASIATMNASEELRSG
jgi:phosphoglycolate phosphatase